MTPRTQWMDRSKRNKGSKRGKRRTGTQIMGGKGNIQDGNYKRTMWQKINEKPTALWDKENNMYIFIHSAEQQLPVVEKQSTAERPAKMNRTITRRKDEPKAVLMKLLSWLWFLCFNVKNMMFPLFGLACLLKLGWIKYWRVDPFIRAVCSTQKF